jgi:hypothetical protein
VDTRGVIEHFGWRDNYRIPFMPFNENEPVCVTFISIENEFGPDITMNSGRVSQIRIW